MPYLPLLLLLSPLIVINVVTFASDLKLQLDADQPVRVTGVDGTTRELTSAEFEELAKKRAEEQAKLQRQTTTDDSTRWQHKEINQVLTQDPQFALHIDLARRAFKEIQRHGYAQGYALSGFSEQDARKKEDDYYVELVLRAQKAPNSGVLAKTGTGVPRQEDDTPLSYEVQLLLDAKKRFSVVAAWELSEKEPPQGQKAQRMMRLSIQPTAALLEREATRHRSRPVVVTWLLAGGLILIVAGLLVLYNSRNPIPAPKPRRRSSDVWELVDETPNKPIKMDKTAKKDD